MLLILLTTLHIAMYDGSNFSDVINLVSLNVIDLLFFLWSFIKHVDD